MEGEIGAALSRARYASSGDALLVWRERPFLAVDVEERTREERVVAGRMDRVVVGMRDGVPRWAEVVDYKTDRVGSEGVEEAARGHAGQMEAYARAVSRQIKVPRERVGWALALTAVGRVWCPREAWGFRG
jgi:ATP-dependent exoDNAse (exonuclease V) beta subunit